MVQWLGRRTHDVWSRLDGSPPGHDTAWLFISETGDRLWRINCLGNCKHNLSKHSFASLRGRQIEYLFKPGGKTGKSPLAGGRLHYVSPYDM